MLPLLPLFEVLAVRLLERKLTGSSPASSSSSNSSTISEELLFSTISRRELLLLLFRARLEEKIVLLHHYHSFKTTGSISSPSSSSQNRMQVQLIQDSCPRLWKLPVFLLVVSAGSFEFAIAIVRFHPQNQQIRQHRLKNYLGYQPRILTSIHNFFGS